MKKCKVLEVWGHSFMGKTLKNMPRGLPQMDYTLRPDKIDFMFKVSSHVHLTEMSGKTAQSFFSPQAP